MATVDVIIPYYNAPREFIGTAIESVLAQTFPDFRCIVVNDGSDAAHSALLAALVAELKDSRIVCVNKANGGAASARNAGMRASDSRYIALLDADDAWYPRRLELQVPLLDRHAEIALVHSSQTLFHDNDAVPATSKAFLNGLTQRQQFVRMLRENFVCVGTTLFRRSCAEAVGGFDESFRNIEDKEFFVRLLANGYNFLYIDEPLVRYRVHPGNKSGNIDRMMLARKRLIERMDALVASRPDLRDLEWPKIRRDMLRHAWQEAAEKCLERGEYAAALRHSLISEAGMSLSGGKVAAAAAYNLVKQWSNR